MCLYNYFFLLNIIMNIILEIKKDYTERIEKIIVPLIYEGLQSIYNESKKISNDDNILKTFQSLLRKIPNWSKDIIDEEVKRIKLLSNNYDLLYNLIKAVKKASIIILSYSPFSDKPNENYNKINYDDISFNKFIHDIYIECAREFWNDPFLFYHNYKSVDIKRNQKDIFSTIKSCIKEVLKKLVPLKDIVDIFLSYDFDNSKQSLNFIENTVTEINDDSLINLDQNKTFDVLLKKQYGGQTNNSVNLNYQDNNVKSETAKKDTDNNVKSETAKKDTDNHVKSDTANKDTDNHVKSDTANKDTDNKVNQDPDSTNDDINNEEKSISSTTSEDILVGPQSKIGGRILDIINNNEALNSSNTKTKYNDKLSNDNSVGGGDLDSVDSKLKDILKNDLDDTITDISISENKTQYQEIFSNVSETSLNTEKKKEIVNKTKFFNNYLQF